MKYRMPKVVNECGVEFVMQRGPLDRYRMVLFLRTDVLRERVVGIIMLPALPPHFLH